MITIGINAIYHEPAVAIVRDGELVAAIEEARLNRVEHGKLASIDNAVVQPFAALDLALEMADIGIADADIIAFGFVPEERYRRNTAHTHPYAIAPGDFGTETGERRFRDYGHLAPGLLSGRYGIELSGRCRTYPHHACHAASAYHLCGHREAAVLAVDGIAEFESTARWHGRDGRLRLTGQVAFPNSLGFLWERLTGFLGFQPGHDEYKVMGLAAYGDPQRFARAFAQFIRVDDAGFVVADHITRFRSSDLSALESLLGPRRWPHEPLEVEGAERRCADIAATLQAVTDRAVIGQARLLAAETGARTLCMAGGVALNCVTNGRLAETGLFEDIWVQPAAHDAGTAVGAATLAWCQATGEPGVRCAAPAYLGPAYADAQIEALLQAMRVPYRRLGAAGVEPVVDLLLAGAVVARFDGRMEFGPRALGNRSILADPRTLAIRQRVNDKIKRREPFRPLCPSVLAEAVDDWFEVPRPLPAAARYMLMTFRVRPARAAEIPAVTHADGTARIQSVTAAESPGFHRLISAFARRTGVPMLLNTSFNSQEPIVCTPQDALRTFLRTELDALVIGDYLVERPGTAPNRGPTTGTDPP